ncbi:M48 family metalloprotease [Bartonella sp. ML70XJBT.G]|uniref:M48 family metalloprotease n=1 Tax=Bartonella sp. ML70XJBT.G TaxID=3019093 RepID=UPI00235E5CCD|nr:M48 family metalloprotease [Bartonella sp. ML70XJBT.G]
MKFATIHLKHAVHNNQRHQIFQRNISFRTRMYRAPFISLTLLLSACHMHLSPNDKLSSDSSETVKHASKHNIYVTLSALQHPRILQKYGGAYYNTTLERLLAQIVHKLARVSQNPQQHYSVTILNSESINAFAQPNGSIYITRGMLALANDSSEVAAILAHEIAHITANHGILRLRKKAELKDKNHFSSPLLSDERGKLHNPIQNKQQFTQFLRNQELEADSIALEMLKKAGYDPFASLRFLQSMEAYSVFRNLLNTTKTSSDFLANHPTTPQRIRLVKEKARNITTVSIGERDRDSFLKSIDGMIFAGSFPTGFVRDNQFIHQQLGVAFGVPNNFTIENSAHTVWASGPDNIAIRFDAIARPFALSASEYLKSGWIIGLDESSVHPITIQGYPGAHARAANAHWQFDVVVIFFKKHAFRFLTAAPHHSQHFEEIATKTIQSFHALSSSQFKKLKPLRIRVVRVQQGESVASLANKMQTATHKETLFRILNALSPTQTLRAGTDVKIISE